MRILAIVALVLLAAVAVTPTATAKPIPPNPCYEHEIAAGVWLNSACGITVEERLMSCPLTGSWKEYHAGNNVVRVYTCDAPE